MLEALSVVSQGGGDVEPPNRLIVVVDYLKLDLFSDGVGFKAVHIDQLSGSEESRSAESVTVRALRAKSANGEVAPADG